SPRNRRAMDFSTLIFFLLAGLLVIASLLVVFLRDVVHCALALVAALLIIAIFFVSLHAPTVGILQIMVYAGAVMVLFLFVIMFLNPAVLERPRALWWSAASILALLLGGLLVPLFFNHEPPGDPVASTELFGSPEMLAKSLFGDFVLPFEIASVLLLVAIVGGWCWPDGSARRHDAAQLLSNPERGGVRHRRGRRADPAEFDRGFDVHRADAQRGQSDVHRFFALSRLDGRPGGGVLCHGRGRRRGGGRPGDHHRGFSPAPESRSPGHADPQMVASNLMAADYDLLRWIALIPLAVAAFNLFWGRALGRKAAGIIACAALGASFALAFYVFWQLPSNGMFRDLVYSWIDSGSFKVNLAFQVDALTAVMLLIVTGIGFLIHIYSLGYMGHDEDSVRFFVYLNLFVFFMLTLVMA